MNRALGYRTRLLRQEEAISLLQSNAVSILKESISIPSLSSLGKLQKKKKKIVPRVLVIRGESGRVRRLCNLAILDLLEGVNPVSLLVQSVLVFRLAGCLRNALKVLFSLVSRTESTYHKMHSIIKNQKSVQALRTNGANSNLLDGFLVGIRM